MTKKFAGKIDHWYRVDYQQYKDAYGPSLGYVVRGHLGEDHKHRGYDNGPIQTSLVVKRYEDNGKTFVETLNSIYELGQPRSTDLGHA